MALSPATGLADYSSGISSSVLTVDSNSDRVGIGTTNPQDTLQVGTAITMGSGTITATQITATQGNFQTIGIAGTLTYEDVTSVDAVGIVTARGGVRVPANSSIVATTDDSVITIGDDNLRNGIQISGPTGIGVTEGYIDQRARFVSHADTGEFYLSDSGDSGGTGRFDATPTGTHIGGSQYDAGDSHVFLGVGGTSHFLGSVGIGTTVVESNEQLRILGNARVTGILTVGTASVTLDGTTGNVSGASLHDTQISNISSSISDTAVDVFIYDTSKDSDGGAWRKRTQHTSWYNETLNTATRGSRREFPAVAVIVAETGKVRIYDGDDPNLPMWMEFNVKSSAGIVFDMIAGGSHLVTASSIFMLNGILCVTLIDALDATSGGMPLINFVSDSSINYRNLTSSFTGAPYLGNIEQRNDGLGNSPDTNSRAIAGGSCFDVAMTVLPNAPIDDATGLPVPTIVIATDGGTSVITDDGTVVDLTGFAPVTTVHIDADNIIGTSHSGTPTHDFIFKTRIPSNDEAFTAGITAGSKNYYMNSNTGTIPLLRDLDMSDSTYDSKDDVVYRGGDPGFDIIRAGVNYSTTHSNPLIANITSDYNTGYMIGDIKGAFLSDTDTTNATELVTNGYFDVDLSGWTTPIGTSSLSANRLLLTAPNGGASWGYAHTSITTEIGKTYKISLHYDRGSADGRLVVKNDSTNSSAGLLEGAGVNAGGWRDLGASDDGETIFATFTATESTTFILVFSKSTTGGTSAYDQISVTLEKDRSINGKGLSVFGTVTKNAVATGADLVAYTGWNANNYLFQPYNSDLNFTNEMSIILWVKDWVSSRSLLHRGPNRTRNNSTSFYLYCDSTHDYRFTLSSDGTTEQNFEILFDGDQYGWQQLCFTLHNGTVRGFLNGVEKELTASTFSGNIFSQATDENGLWIGRGPVSGFYPENADIALLRISGSAPSPEQIKEMYDDEKVLFQENAKATLYGSSDAVTALAYDDSNNVFHVGTSSGRSEFQGLRRINNTTTAVTTAISASNGLVAEQ